MHRSWEYLSISGKKVSLFEEKRITYTYGENEFEVPGGGGVGYGSREIPEKIRGPKIKSGIVRM